jgi:hypothetical protein
MLSHENYDCWARKRRENKSFEEFEGQEKN